MRYLIPDFPRQTSLSGPWPDVRGYDDGLSAVRQEPPVLAEDIPRFALGRVQVP